MDLVNFYSKCRYRSFFASRKCLNSKSSDQTYGGILTKDAMLDSNAEFGAGYYNDHHFHYGMYIL